MSNRITSLCRPLRMKPAQKAVLMCLADRASDEGLAWPSIPGICEWTCLGRTAVIDAVHALEGLGCLAVVRMNGKQNRVTFNLERLEALNQSASRTGSPRGRVRQTDPTSPPPGPVPVRLPDGTSPPPGPEASVHQGCTTEAPPLAREGGGSAAPAGAGGKELQIPTHGDPALWEKLRAIRRPSRADWDAWALAARELYPAAGKDLDKALKLLVNNSHWRQLPGPDRGKGGAPARRSLEGMDYTKGLS